jgi:hypothetical protein
MNNWRTDHLLTYIFFRLNMRKTKFYLQFNILYKHVHTIYIQIIQFVRLYCLISCYDDVRRPFLSKLRNIPWRELKMHYV